LPSRAIFFISVSGGIRGIFERRGREGFAKGAKGIPNERKERAKNLKNQHPAKQLSQTRSISFKNIFWYFLSSSAFSAKPSRPLRSKMY
jgi:hypothetical protein